MAPRPRLIDLTPAARKDLLGALFTYLTDPVVDAHPRAVYGPGADIRWVAPIWTADADAFLARRGSGPLPMWNPADPIPSDFALVRSHDDGRPRQPLADTAPGLPVPGNLLQPLLARFREGGPGPGAALQDYDARMANAVGGVLTETWEGAAAPIAWCWYAWVTDLMQDYEAGWQGQPTSGATFSRIQLARNQDGRLQFMLNTTSGALHSVREMGTGLWSHWRELHTSMDDAVTVAGPDGRLASFGGRGRWISWACQAALGSADWAQPQQVHGGCDNPIQGIAAVLTPDNRLDIFGVSAGVLYCNWQARDGSGAFGGWGEVGGRGIQPVPLAMMCAADGCIQVIHIGSDTRAWLLRQNTNGYCDNPIPIYNQAGVVDARAVVNTAGYASVFARVATNTLYLSEQTGAHAWGDFRVVADSVAAAWPVANANGRLELFMRNEQGELAHRWQASPGSSDWEAGPVFEGVADVQAVTACPGQDGRLVVIVLAGNRLYRTVQITANDPTAYTPLTLYY